MRRWRWGVVGGAVVPAAVTLAGGGSVVAAAVRDHQRSGHRAVVPRATSAGIGRADHGLKLMG
jgi:hypothetical protein